MLRCEELMLPPDAGLWYTEIGIKNVYRRNTILIIQCTKTGMRNVYQDWG
jgi:hypothetical protein